MTRITIGCDNWDPLDSYGQIAAVLATNLKHYHGWHIHGIAGSRTDLSHCSTSTQLILGDDCRSTDCLLSLGWPSLYQQFHQGRSLGIPKVAITMFESTDLQAGWADILNQYDCIILPSDWLIDVYRRAGVTTRIVVIPLGISQNYTFIKRPYQKPFTMLTMGSPGLRKGWDVTTRAFYRAFGEDEDYQLLIKVRDVPFDPGPIPPNIKVLAADLSNEEMRALYGRVDAAVCASRGEGFGLPAREAAATGLPVIATRWSGLADSIESWGIGLDYSMTYAWPRHPNPSIRRCGTWAEPDETHLVSLLKNLVKKPTSETVLQDRSAFVKQRYSWNRFSEGVATEIKKIKKSQTSSSGKGNKKQAVIHVHPKIRWHLPFAEKASRGLRAAGIPHAVTSSKDRYDSGLPILLGTSCWREIEQAGPFLLVDRCSFGDPGEWVSLVLSGHGRRGDHRTPERPDPSRWSTFGVPVQPWRYDGDDIILCGQCETYSPHYKVPADWYHVTAQSCTHFRPHPADRNYCKATAALQPSPNWNNASQAITLNSSVAIEAVLAGVPTITMDEAAMAWDVTGHRPDEVLRPERDEWLHWLAWTQWHHEEIATSVPWQRFL